MRAAPGCNISVRALISACIEQADALQIARLLRYEALWLVAGVKARVAGVLQHQTLSGSGLDLGLVQELAIVGSNCAHPHPQLLR